MAMHRTIYPEDRQVNDATVIMWYEDAFANGELAPEFPKYPDIDTMKRGLDDAGLVTFASDDWDADDDDWDADDDDNDWRAGHGPEHDGQPDEMQEWHDFDPDC